MTPLPNDVRERLGREVHEERTAWGAENWRRAPTWDALPEPERECNRRIGERLWRRGLMTALDVGVSACGISVRRTGGAFGIAASEYEVTFPNGCTETVWSPVWNDYSPDREDAGALKWGVDRWVEIVEAWEATVPEDGMGIRLHVFGKDGVCGCIARVSHAEAEANR